MRLSFLLFLLMFSGCFDSPPADPVNTKPYDTVLGLGTHSMEKQAREELDSLGVEYVRHTLYTPLYAFHPTYPISWAAKVDTMTQTGFKMLIVVHPLPEGWSPEEYANHVAEVVRDFPKVDAWQIGNEDLFGGTVQNHIKYHNAAYDAIKSINAEATVVSMAFSDEKTTRTFISLGAKFDFLAVHTYGFPVWQVVKNWESLAQDYPVWITEFGFQIYQYPPDRSTENWEDEQLIQWKGAVEQARMSGFRRAYGYQLRTQEPLETHGIIREADGTWRPTAHWFRSILSK